MRRILPTLALVSLSLPLAVGAAQAQTTPSTAAPSNNSNNSIAAKSALTNNINPSNPLFQRTARSTELSGTNPSTVTSAWSTISNDESFTQFTELVKAAGLETMFQRSDSASTYFVPTNEAFRVLDPRQLARLKEPRFKNQAATIVRQLVAKGSVSLSDMTRRLPTGLAPTPPKTAQYCATIGGTFINGLNIGGTQQCSTFTLPTPTVAPAIESITTDAGNDVPLRVYVIPSASTGNHFRVSLANGAYIETADYPVTNGVLHSIDTLPIPTQLGRSLADIVGR